MSKKPRHIPSRPIKKNIPALPASITNELVALFNAGQWETLRVKASAATKSYPQHILGWKALGKALLKLGILSEAIDALSRVAKLSPTDADAYNDIGSVLEYLGRKEEAETNYRHALKHNPRFPEAYSNLGGLLASQGRFEEAVTNHQKSIQLNPNSAAAHNNLGNALRDLGRFDEAETSYRRALELNPNFLEVCINLGLLLEDQEQWDNSQACYRRALAINPNSSIALQCLGKSLGIFGDKDDEAIACLERLIALNPNDADAHVALGNILMRTDQTDKCWAMFRRARDLRPFITWPAKKETPDFSVVLIDTPFAGCTPIDYLIDKASYDRHFYCLIPDAPNDIDLLQSKGDIVINMIGDADNGQDILPFALEVADRLNRPIVNHPRLIMNTDRETVAQRLAGIPLCRIPKTIRLAGTELITAIENKSLEEFTMPLLVRLTGRHGGDDLEKFDDLNAVVDYVAKNPEVNYYVTEYVDYRSTDGFFRKYRFISVAGELFPYHLAIHDGWMVHHFRTDMANNEWMRQEEESFLKDSHLVFDEPRQAALRAIASAIGLDYCGIDCALDSNGDIVVFEVNATMRVHGEKNETFTYKNPYIAKIKEAFEAMLFRLANSGSNASGAHDFQSSPS
jgi:Flp pilus assembly protein TadD